MKPIKPNCPELPEAKATPEQLAIRKWFLGLSREESCQLVAQTRGMKSQQAAEFFRRAYRAAMKEKA